MITKTKLIYTKDLPTKTIPSKTNGNVLVFLPGRPQYKLLAFPVQISWLSISKTLTQQVQFHVIAFSNALELYFLLQITAVELTVLS